MEQVSDVRIALDLDIDDMSHTHIFYILQLYSAGSLVADGKYVVPKGVAVEELKNYSGESILCIMACVLLQYVSRLYAMWYSYMYSLYISYLILYVQTKLLELISYAQGIRI